jgi:hypothetical protein
MRGFRVSVFSAFCRLIGLNLEPDLNRPARLRKVKLAQGRSPFPRVYDQTFSVQGNPAWFGRDVLQGLVDGIEEFAARPRPSSWAVGPVLLGCSPWVNDEQLLAALTRLTGACVVLGKRQATQWDRFGWRRLRAANAATPGVLARAFSELAHLAPSEDGEPAVFGPFDRVDEDLRLSTFHTIGHRKTGQANPPLAHAKLALLGYIWWHDEDALGNVDDVLFFQPLRLWISSANFTVPSRRHLEFGFWTEDPALLDGAHTFLCQLIASSESLDAPSDQSDPELLPVELDMEWFAEYAAEVWQPDEDEDDEP